MRENYITEEQLIKDLRSWEVAFSFETSDNFGAEYIALKRKIVCDVYDDISDIGHMPDLARRVDDLRGI